MNNGYTPERKDIQMAPPPKPRKPAAIPIVVQTPDGRKQTRVARDVQFSSLHAGQLDVQWDDGTISEVRLQLFEVRVTG